MIETLEHLQKSFESKIEDMRGEK